MVDTPPTRSHLWMAAPLGAAVLLFLPGVFDAGFVADDAFNLAEHARHGDVLGEWTTPTYAHAGGERGHIWRPLPATIQHLAALALGRTGVVFRLLNLLVHLINVALVGWLARRLGASARAAAVLALLFTTHPTLPEAVCWSSDIYDLMATTVALITVGIGLSGRLDAKRMAALAGLALLGGLCKESAVAIVPAVAIAVGGLRSWRSGLAAAGATATGAVTYLAWHGAVTAQGYGAAVAQAGVIESAKAGLMAVGWWVVVPVRAPMAHLYGTGDVAEVWTGLGVLVVCSIGCLWLRRHNPAAAGALAVGLLAGGVLLGPAAIGIPFIGIAPFRYAYGSLAVVLGLTGAALAAFGSLHRGWTVAAALIIVSGGLRSAVRVTDWKDDATLWSAELAREPDNAYAAGSLARAFVATGRTDEALDLWADAVDQVAPGVRVFDRSQERWLLAQTAFMKGHPEIALEQVDKLMTETERIPDMAYCLRADSLDALGRRDEASVAARLCRP